MAVLLCVMFVIFYTQAFIAPKVRPPVGRSQSGQTEPAASVDETKADPLADVSEFQAEPVQGGASLVERRAEATLNDDRKFPKHSELKAAPVTRVILDRVVVEINHLGGRLQKVLLSDYRDQMGNEGTPLNLLAEEVDRDDLPGAVIRGSTADHRVLYRVVEIAGGEKRAEGVFPATNSPLKIVLAGTWPSGGQIQKQFVFSPKLGYLIGL